MDITRHNFLQSLPLIADSIQTADFISFDTEFSGSILFLIILINILLFLGLSVGYEDKGHEYDTVEDRY